MDFTSEEEDRMMRLRQQGLSYSEIAERLDRTQSSIKSKVQKIRVIWEECDDWPKEKEWRFDHY